MKKDLDIVYVVASKLGTIGMGCAAYHAIKGIEDCGLSYKAFSRGYISDINLNKQNLTNYSFLEYLSYPFRFLEKKLGWKINSFKLVNYLFGKLVELNLPKSKIYHTWIGISPKAVLKAKKNGAILVLEGANSHPLNVARILNKEFKKYGQKDLIMDIEKIRKESEILKLFDYIFCPSPFVYDSYLKEGFAKNKLRLIPYGVDINKFNVKKDKKDKKFRAIFIGSLQLRKGVEYILQAWDELKLKNAELLIVGRAWPDAQDIVKKYKNNPSIKFIGFADLRQYYAMSDIFVFPSIEEGSALVNYEAMACGLPVITTHHSGSIVRNNKDGFIIPIRSVKAIKDKIRYLYNHPDIRKRMGENARKNVENYSWEKYGKRLTQSYKEISMQK